MNQQCVKRGTGLACLVALMSVLSGCGNDQDDLRAWMDEVRRSTPVVREVLDPPKSFEPFRYVVAGFLEPFSQQRLNGAAGGGHESGSLRPDMNRAKEPLESFALDSFKLVGHLRQGRRYVALMQVDNMVHSVRVGDRVGQNFGRVTKISEAEVSVKELVQDAAGEWVERDSALRLQETRP